MPASLADAEVGSKIRGVWWEWVKVVLVVGLGGRTGKRLSRVLTEEQRAKVGVYLVRSLRSERWFAGWERRGLWWPGEGGRGSRTGGGGLIEAFLLGLREALFAEVVGLGEEGECAGQRRCEAMARRVRGDGLLELWRRWFF